MYFFLALIIIIFILAVGGLIYLLYFEIRYSKNKTPYFKTQTLYRIPNNELVSCPRCKSTQISANKKGFSFMTGLIGSQSVFITCLHCGKRWKAGL